MPISEVPDVTLWRRQKQWNYSRASFRTWGPMTRYRRVKFLNASARALQLFPRSSDGVTIRRQGTKAPVKTLEARDRRSPLTTWRMSRISAPSPDQLSLLDLTADDVREKGAAGGLGSHKQHAAVLEPDLGGLHNHQKIL